MAIITRNVNLIINELKKGGIVALPTETVYGLACSIYCPKAIENIFKIKNRPMSQALSIVLKDKKYINRVALNISSKAENIIAKFLPGPLTIILEKQAYILPIITAQNRFLGIRVPDNNDILNVLNNIDFPLVLTSANIHGYCNCINPEQVKKQLDNKIKYIYDGGTCKLGLESTIVKITTENDIQILREGAIKKEELVEFM